MLSKKPCIKKDLRHQCLEEMALIDGDILEQKRNLNELQKKKKKGIQMKHAANVRKRQFVRLRPSSDEARVRNQVLLGGDLVDEVITLLAKAMHRKMKRERGADGRQAKLFLPKSIWELLRELLVARGAASERWNEACISSSDVVKSVFHQSRVGFLATVKKFSTDLGSDCAYLFVTPSYPITFHYSSMKGVIIRFFFQYIDKNGVQLTTVFE